MKYTIRVKPYQKYFKYVSILGVVLKVNGLKDFTDTEARVLASFLSIRDELSSMEDLVFSTKARDRVAKELEMTKSNLNNYIGYLVEKRAISLREGSKVLYITPSILPRQNADGSLEITFHITTTNE